MLLAILHFLEKDPSIKQDNLRYKPVANGRIAMRKIDGKHLAFHVLVALYFIWVAVFGVLIGMAMANAFGPNNPALGSVFMTWILLNFFTGSALFVVIRMFRYSTLLVKFITYSYILMALAGIAAVVVITNGT